MRADQKPEGSLLFSLVREIRRTGPMPFRRFMEIALYSEQFGYYRRSRAPFGTSGDFYTAVQLQPVFGQLVRSYVARCGDGADVVDLGAGRAGLAPALVEWKYFPVEWDGGTLPAKFRGVAIANEFFDALPVHVLQRAGNRWIELAAGVTPGGRLEFVPGPEPASQLTEYAERYGGSIPDGGMLEANLEMELWISRVAGALECGRLLAIDYGYDANELARFPSGTLMSYRRHAAIGGVLERPGEQDITALVNFTALKSAAERAGLGLKKECSLRAWMLDVWGPEVLAKLWEEADARWRMQWKQLAIGMGETFRVLEFEKAGY